MLAQNLAQGKNNLGEKKKKLFVRTTLLQRIYFFDPPEKCSELIDTKIRKKYFQSFKITIRCSLDHFYKNRH